MTIKLIVTICLIVLINMSFSLLSRNKQAIQSVPDIIRSNGYSAEVHKVRTEDDYILELHRILPRRENVIQKSPVVFMHHCLLCSSYEFVVNSPNISLGYILADAGYDVWLANSRGNYYSRNHLTLSPNRRKFWDFSMDEISLRDLPAGINYALKVSGQKKLNYVGYSMGSAVILALLSDKIEYNDKIQLLILVAPAAYVSHNKGPLLPLAEGVVLNFFRMLNIYEVLPGESAFDIMTSFFCTEPFAPICDATLEQLTGLKTKYLKRGLLPTIISHTPAGTSFNNILHFTQGARSGEFRKFDYGRSKNLRQYGTEIPPSYNINKVTSPVGIISSQDDWLAAPEDVKRVRDELPNVVFSKQIIGEEFSHLDFLWTERAESLVYQDILKLLNKYSNEHPFSK